MYIIYVIARSYRGPRGILCTRGVTLFPFAMAFLSATCQRHTSRRRCIAFACGKNIVSSLFKVSLPGDCHGIAVGNASQ